MTERQRLLALLECYDEAIEELYVLGDRGLLDLILRLERRRGDADRRLASLDEARMSPWVAQEITATMRPQIEGRAADQRPS